MSVWAYETGAAEIAAGTLVVSGPVSRKRRKPGPPWSPVVLAVAEALLCGLRRTVKATQEATGLSAGSCAHALQVLGELELIQSTTGRGPRSGRTVRDRHALLRGLRYGRLIPPARDQSPTWSYLRDPIQGLRQTVRCGIRRDPMGGDGGRRRRPARAVPDHGDDDAGLRRRRDRRGPGRVARRSNRRPLEGGRRRCARSPPLPSPGCSSESRRGRGPGRAVDADLRLLGARGEEAAEHLAEVNDVDYEAPRPAPPRAAAERASPGSSTTTLPTPFVALGGPVPALLCSGSDYVDAGATVVDVQVNLEIAAGAVNGARLEQALRNADFEPETGRGWRWTVVGGSPRTVVKFESLADLADQPAEALIRFDGADRLVSVTCGYPVPLGMLRFGGLRPSSGHRADGRNQRYCTVRHSLAKISAARSPPIAKGLVRHGIRADP